MDLIKIDYFWIFFLYLYDKFSINIYLPNPPATGAIFKQTIAGLISEFSFSWTSCHTNAKEPNLPYYLPIAGREQLGSCLFQGEL